MSRDLIRAEMLLSQGRYEMAERELRGVLAVRPDDAAVHAMLAACIVQDQTRYTEATTEAQQAVALSPDDPYGHFVLSVVLFRRSHLKESLAAIAEAIRLDPYDADYFGHKAAIHLSMRDWQDTLDAAVQGLAINPEHSPCNNARSIALERLGRGAEAVEAAAANLQSDPDDSYSHSAFGWTLLSNGKYSEAQDAFREALRLDPANEMAREGMINALNSRSFLFRVVHRFHLALSRLSHQHQFAIIFGAWILINVMHRAGRNVAWVEPLIPFVLMAYMAFAVLTWTSDAVFNTFLRFHPFGRHLLSRDKIWTSNLVATCLISSFVGSVYTLFTAGALAAIVVAFYWLLMCVPATVPFVMPTQKRAIGIGLAGLAIGLIPVYGTIQAVTSNSAGPFVVSMQTFNWSIIGLQVAAGFLAVAPNRQ